MIIKKVGSAIQPTLFALIFIIIEIIGVFHYSVATTVKATLTTADLSLPAFLIPILAISPEEGRTSIGWLSSRTLSRFKTRWNPPRARVLNVNLTHRNTRAAIGINRRGIGDTVNHRGIHLIRLHF
jgi:hypothetical protein